jgi:hypothetical protein
MLVSDSDIQQLGSLYQIEHPGARQVAGRNSDTDKFESDFRHRLFQVAQQTFIQTEIGGTHRGQGIAPEQVGITLWLT